MHILIKDFNGFKTSFEIETTSTIEQVKEKFYQSFRVPKEGQVLFLNGSQLDDNKKISDYNINEGATLDLSLNENYIEINAVNVMGKRMPFYLKLSDTIQTIKKKIEEREGIPENVQKLIYDPKNQKLDLEDNKTIQDYNFKKEATIQILYK